VTSVYKTKQKLFTFIGCQTKAGVTVVAFRQFLVLQRQTSHILSTKWYSIWQCSMATI